MKQIINKVLFYLVLVAILGLGYYGIYRNNKVRSYRNQLAIQIMYVGSAYHDVYEETIYKRYSYTEMFLSFKPMESKYWFTGEEIEKYKLELVDNAVK